MSTERTLPTQRPRARLVVMMDVTPEHEEEFNLWYDREHLPERAQCPGFLSAQRFVNVEGGPKYGAIYELESADVLQSDAYLAILQDSPWTSSLRPHLSNLTRAVYEEIEVDLHAVPVEVDRDDWQNRRA